MNLSELKPHELFFILRQRQGLDQRQWGRRFKMSQALVSQIEHGRRSLRPKAVKQLAKYRDTRPLSDGERLEVMSRRVGLNRKDLATTLDVPEYQVLEMARDQRAIPRSVFLVLQ